MDRAQCMIHFGSLGFGGAKKRTATQGTKTTEFLKMYLCGENGVTPLIIESFHSSIPRIQIPKFPIQSLDLELTPGVTLSSEVKYENTGSQ